MPCPVCREKFDIPEEGYGGLRKNFFMSKLIDIKSISSPSSKEKVCDACKEDIEDTECEVPLAESFCVECHQNLCQECSKHHKKNKLTKAHKVIALGSPIDVSEVTRNFPLDLCHHHATKPLETMLEDFLINNNNNIVGKLQDGDEAASVGSSFPARELRRQAENLERQNEKLRRKLERVTKMRKWMEKDTENSQILEKHEEQNLMDVDANIAGNQRKYKNRLFELTPCRAHRKKRKDETERLRQERKDLEEKLTQTVKDIRRLEMELETLSRSNVDLKAELGTVKKTNADKIG